MSADFALPLRRPARFLAPFAAAIAMVLQVCVADDSSAPPAKPIQPTAAMSAIHADQGLLLGVVDTGKELIAVGGNGDIVQSGDGLRWTQVPTPVDITLTGVAFADDSHGWAVGHDAAILHTDDGGHSWTVQNYQPDLNSPLFAVLALDPQRALAVGAFGLFKATEDGGAHWTDVDAPEVLKDKLHLNAVIRLASGELLIAGEHGLIAVSTDGHKWQRLTAPYEGSFFGALPWGSRGAIAYGLRGTVFATDDVNVDQWQKIDVRTTSSFFGGFALPGGQVALVGSEGLVLKIDPTGRAQVLLDSSRRKGQAGSFAGVVPYQNKLVVVGESGVEQVSLK